MKKLSPTVFLIILFIVACVVLALLIQVPPAPPATPSPETLPRTDDVPPSSSLSPSPDLSVGPSVGTAPQNDGMRGHAVQDPFCLEGCPRGAPASDIIVTHHILELSDNVDTKFADWVAYRISEDTLGSGCKRTWEEDPDLSPDVTLRPSDYKGMRAALASDRGHQAPLASLCGSPYWQEADYLSNITPQKTDLNEGAWEHLENGERGLIRAHVSATVYSLTGPLFERAMPALPYAHEDHKVPSGYWKLISVATRDGILFAGFIMDQDTARDADFCQEKVPLLELEKRSKLLFFPLLDPATKDGFEHKGVSSELLSALGC